MAQPNDYRARHQRFVLSARWIFRHPQLIIDDTWVSVIANDGIRNQVPWVSVHTFPSDMHGELLLNAPHVP